MTTNKERCACCDQTFSSLSELLAHMKIHHTEHEVLASITKEENEQANISTQSYA